MLVQIGQPRAADVPPAYQKKSVIGCWVDQDGTGYVVRLSCRHRLWMPIIPQPEMYCGHCLSDLLRSMPREVIN